MALVKKKQIVGKARAVSGAGDLTIADDIVLADASGGAFTLTLPTASSANGRTITVKKTDSSANAVTVDGNGSETIDGAATLSLSSQYDSAIIASDGTSWKVLATKNAGGGAVTVDPRDIFRYSLIHSVS